MLVRFISTNEILEIPVSYIGDGLITLHATSLTESMLSEGFQLLTEKGILFGNCPNHKTIYQSGDGFITLSDDGRVYTPKPEPKQPTLEELKERKKNKIGTICELMIYAGISPELSTGIEHFSLTEKDQINLFGKQAQLSAGVEKLEYHQDGHPCKYYSAQDMLIIVTLAMQHVSYHTTRCNAINMWIAGCETKEELEIISYDADIPKCYQNEVLRDYMAKMKEA